MASSQVPVTLDSFTRQWEGDALGKQAPGFAFYRCHQCPEISLTMALPVL